MVPLWRQAAVKGLAYHEHLYTRVVAAGQTDEIERWLATVFESPGEEAIQKAVTDAHLTTQDWSRLIKFLAAQHVRTPVCLMEMHQLSVRTLQDTLPDTLNESVKEFETARREGNPLPHDSHADSEHLPCRVTIDGGMLRFEIIAGRELWLYNLKHLLTRTVDALLAHKWTILRSPEEIEWVTSDDPVVRLNYHNSNKYDFGGGWDSRGTEIFLPLSPRHLLYTKIGTEPPRRGEVLSAELATCFQRFTIEHAHRYVFAAAQDVKVSEHRPRIVDKEVFADEMNQWSRWHEEQSTAERSLYR
jgi:hypothetical protein